MIFKNTVINAVQKNPVINNARLGTFLAPATLTRAAERNRPAGSPSIRSKMSTTMVAKIFEKLAFYDDRI